MSIREKLAGLGSVVKEKVGAAFADPDQLAAERELDAELGLAHEERAATVAATVAAPMDETTARRVLGLSDTATLDEVRVAAAALARPALAGAAANDNDAAGALERIATAAELLEERLLPLAGAPLAGAGAVPPTAPASGGRIRATARR